MKTLNNFSKVKTIALFAFMALAVTACGGKKGGNNNGYYPNGYNPYQCTTCTAGSIPLLNSVKFQHGNHMEGNVTIFGVNNGTADMNDPKAIVAYQGDVQLAGQLSIYSGGAYFCYAQQGLYNLTPMAPAISEYGVLSNVRMLAQGAEQRTANTQIILESSGPSAVYNTDISTGTFRDSQTNRIGFTLRMTVNGQPCGEVWTN